MATKIEQVMEKGDIVQNGRLVTRKIAPVTSVKFESHVDPKTEKISKVEVTTTATVKPSGTMWVCHPMPK